METSQLWQLFHIFQGLECVIHVEEQICGNIEISMPAAQFRVPTKIPQPKPWPQHPFQSKKLQVAYLGSLNARVAGLG